ncbi:MAG: CoA transferase [Chloroflexi bacterium]|nr:CoA transferase [Chloroflexota bacterium]
MSHVLDGIKVLDLASMWAGPAASMHLGDQGAEVIKIEPPEGDTSRRLFTHPKLGNESPSFLVVNRNKRGMALDLGKAEGRAVAKRLASQTDVLIHNYRPGVAKRLGLDYEELSRENKRLIYVELTAYGKEGPHAKRAGYDLLIQAQSGMLHRRLPDGTPLSSGVWVADCSTPMLIAYGVVLALIERSRTGKGQKVETSLLQAAIAMQMVDLVKPEAEEGVQRAPMTQSVFGMYRCQDGQWIIPVALSEKEWVKLCKALDLEHLTKDPAFASAQLRADNNQQLLEILIETFASKPRDEWLKRLEEHDVPCAPVVEREQVPTQPQVVANGMMTEISHPTAGRTLMMSPAVRLSRNPPSIRRHSPMQGQHTEEVLREAGYTAKAIEELRRKGALGKV